MFGVCTQKECSCKFEFLEILSSFFARYQVHRQKVRQKGDTKSNNDSFSIYAHAQSFFESIVPLETGAYFERFWSILIMSEPGMEYFSTMLTISLWNLNSVSLLAHLVNSGRVAVQALLAKPIQIVKTQDLE